MKYIKLRLNCQLSRSDLRAASTCQIQISDARRTNADNRYKCKIQIPDCNVSYERQLCLSDTNAIHTSRISYITKATSRQKDPSITKQASLRIDRPSNEKQSLRTDQSTTSKLSELTRPSITSNCCLLVYLPRSPSPPYPSRGPLQAAFVNK